ncbi:MAG: glycosyltransferase family 39 protein [Cephaloticoccus sp.]|nr:glycosyltransferase family 39 protein [Cephaloticoccus sp.]MCF7759727.1 glycosyltransferase family 39 protein [Cephaloticoccus sp.]
MLTKQRIAPLLLLALFGWLALSVSSRVGVTADETAHLTAGFTYWTTGDYRLQPENGNLPQRWAALPLVLAQAHFPTLAGAAWARADVWLLGHEFFFGSGNDTDKLLFSGRAMIVLFGIALAALTYLWSRQLFGAVGGLITLGFVVFNPHLLAHSALITSDLAAALGFLLALATWWRLCHRLTPGRILSAGLAMGFLALSKYSAAIFAPVAIAILILRVLRPAPLPWRIGRQCGRFASARRTGALLVGAIMAGGIAFVMIWGAYGFRYAASPETGMHMTKPWSDVLIERPHVAGSIMAAAAAPADPVDLKPGVVQAFVRWGRNNKVLPEAYLYGLAFTDLHARGRLAYFAGEYRENGWWEFFPVAFVLKTTLPTLLLLGLTFLAFTRTKPALRSRWLYRLAPLLIFVGIYWVFAITSHLNIGHRHLLPIYPALLIIAGYVGSSQLNRRSRIWMLGAGLLLFWHAVESWRVRPHYLTYFNTFAGGPAGGHRYLVDSSLDWGQGLPDLQAWLATHQNGEPVFLSYFGSDDPLRFGLKTTRIGDIYFDFAPRSLLPPLTEGIYCISATMLHRVYTQVRGPWSTEYENDYQRRLTENLDHLAGMDPDMWQQNLLTLEQLRFGRLCHFLENRPPDAIVANSIFIYRLSPTDIAQALSGIPPY